MLSSNKYHPYPLSASYTPGRSRWRILRGGTRGWGHLVPPALAKADMGSAAGDTQRGDEVPGGRQVSCRGEHSVWFCEDRSHMDK